MSSCTRCTWAFLAVVGLGSLAAHASAEPVSGPRALNAVAVEERLGAQVPLDLTFERADGTRAAFAELIGTDQPVLLVLSYARCATLCNWVLRGISDGMAGMRSLTLGRDYRTIFVSIDDRESSSEALAKQAALLERVHKPGARALLPYLIHGGSSTRRLAEVLGFRYAWDPGSQQYAHPSVVFVLAPGGRIAHYLYGVTFPPAELERALRAASRPLTLASAGVAEPLGSLLRCFRLDPAARRHGATIRLVFQVAGAALLLLVGLLLFGLHRRDRQRRAP